MTFKSECIAGHRETGISDSWPLQCPSLCRAPTPRLAVLSDSAEYADVRETIRRCGGYHVVFEAFGWHEGSA